MNPTSSSNWQCPTRRRPACSNEVLWSCRDKCDINISSGSVLLLPINAGWCWGSAIHFNPHRKLNSFQKRKNPAETIESSGWRKFDSNQSQELGKDISENLSEYCQRLINSIFQNEFQEFWAIYGLLNRNDSVLVPMIYKFHLDASEDCIRIVENSKQELTECWSNFVTCVGR